MAFKVSQSLILLDLSQINWLWRSTILHWKVKIIQNLRSSLSHFLALCFYFDFWTDKVKELFSSSELKHDKKSQKVPKLFKVIHGQPLNWIEFFSYFSIGMYHWNWPTSVMPNECYTPSKQTLWKWGYIGESKHNLKNAASILSRKYVWQDLVLSKRGNVDLCRSNGCKVTSCQSLRFEKNPTTQLLTHCEHTSHVGVRMHGIILKVWHLVIL